MAATAWGERGRVMPVNPSLGGYLSDLLHQAVEEGNVGSEYGIFMREASAEALAALGGGKVAALGGGKGLLQRFIGVVYSKRTERISHYVHCDASRQYDLIIHVDSSHAVRPLPSPRPGTTDYSRWDAIDDDDTENL